MSRMRLKCDSLSKELGVVYIVFDCGIIVSFASDPHTNGEYSDMITFPVLIEIEYI